MKCTTTASFASVLIVQCMIFGHQKRYLEKSTEFSVKTSVITILNFYLSIWLFPILSKPQNKQIKLHFIQLISTLGNCLHTLIGPPEQFNLFLYSTPSEYKLINSRVCLRKSCRCKAISSILFSLQWKITSKFSGPFDTDEGLQIVNNNLITVCNCVSRSVSNC